MADLGDIITSKVRIKILELFFSNPDEMYHVRGVVREIKEEINAVRRELARLEKSGILKKEPRGNRVYYWPRTDHFMFGDILSVVSKMTGLGLAINSNKKIGNPSIIMFSGRFARRKERKREDDVDILIVGEVNLPELASLVRMEESKRGMEINYTVMTRDELEYRKKRRDPFLQGILAGSRVMILGDEDNLVS
ncbi:MAG: Transcriptional regulator [Candidatus Woesebacteria bacterium GW2011_GWB1_43_14]|uniref:Transcriptional regulator n=1 Tax=Candidatus Woesebacteria bacterium GW2011_GWB1_43_14 TaxID=1618578 RepID=A0A0G1DHL6_9BACT|nr:MAG: Transcriptional regulator [Candidatus Woesebacteria bacterium GW2011_GWA1_39_11b]KKS78060.1 MAG: Transcriptional regulator [Candidatus Woesebacteria bacterium GW2011_GWC1_42_9]KKS97360.1 MAG: Transcriptional regulator [Candidatus Woesebacteria bacterium GW2011_GWB1_43_14]